MAKMTVGVFEQMQDHEDETILRKRTHSPLEDRFSHVWCQFGALERIERGKTRDKCQISSFGKEISLLAVSYTHLTLPTTSRV